MTSPPALPETALEQAGARITETSLHIVDPTSLNWARIEQIGGFLGAVGIGYPFWVGDLILTVDKVFGENSPEASQLETLFPHTPHTLQNYRWVAESIPPNRRRPHLGFGVHEAVASLEPDARDRWLDVAEAQGWKREEMRGAIRTARERGELPTRRPGPVGNPAVTSDATFNGDLVPGLHTCPTCGQPLKGEE